MVVDMAKQTSLAKLTEFVQCDASKSVDREAGVIRGVKLLGLTSRNGRRYTEQALREGAAKYEGARVHLDHGKPGENRSVMTRAGVIRNVSYREGEGLYGDLQYLKGDKAGEKIATLAEQCPDTFGMSHDAEGRMVRKNGESVVEAIESVNSVDAVDRPATTNSLHEQEEPKMKKTTLRKLVEATGYKHTAKLLEMLPEVTPDAELPVVDETPADPADAVADALAAKVIDAIKDPAVDDAEVGKIAKAASKTVAMVRGDMEPQAEDPAEETEEETTEENATESLVLKSVKKLTEQLTATQKRLDAREVLEGAGAVANPQLMEELLKCGDRQAMQSLVEGWSPAKLGRQKPIVGRVTESTKYPSDHKSFVRELKRSR